MSDTTEKQNWGPLGFPRALPAPLYVWPEKKPNDQKSSGRSGMSDDLKKRLREVTGNKLDYTRTPNHLRLTAADRIEELEAKLAKAVDEILDAASSYIKEQYGIGALSNPVDRERIIAELKEEDRG